MTKEINSPESYFLEGSQILFTDKDMLVTTILGSCVSIILYSDYFKFTSISHALLPNAKPKKRDDSFREAKFVDSSILKMLSLFDEKDVSHKYLKAKLYGGAESLTLEDNEQLKPVGRKNVNAAQKCLNKFGLEIVHEDVGENFSRKITYNTNNNQVKLKKIEYRESVHSEKSRVQFINS